MVLLDIDMPNCCAECPLFEDRYDYPTCYVTQKSEGYNFDIFHKKWIHVLYLLLLFKKLLI